MASAYQPTTEHCESLESIDNKATCNPIQRWGSGRRQREIEQGRDSNGKYSTSSPEEKQKDESSGRPLFRSCLSRQDDHHGQDPPAALTPAESQQSLASRSENYPRTGSTSKLSRVQTFRKKIVQSTEQFLGLGDCEEDHINLQKKWIHRKQRHFSKRYGRLIHEDVLDGPLATGLSQPRMPSVRGSVGSFHDTADPTIYRTLSRRQSVATMAWKGLRSRLKSGTLVRDAQQKPVSSLLEVGRSFAPHSVVEGEAFYSDEDVDSADDDVFFDFANERSRVNRSSMQAMHDILPKIEEEKPDEPADEAFGKDEVEGPPLPPKTSRQISTASTRGHRLAVRPPRPINANRRQFGKGLVGRMLNRTIRRKRITSEVRKQLEHLTDHRPFFTYWVSFVQVIVLIATLSLYGVSPVGFTKTKRSAVIQRSRGGGLVSEYIEDSTPDNFWIGPDQRSLIILGAKYAPCMRTDTILSKEIKKEKAIEAETGCCIKTDNSGCIQTSRKSCSKSFATFNYNTTAGDPNRVDRVVCGQDPKLCTSPPSVAPHEWKKDITEWPICKKSAGSNKYLHMTCNITGRPCCIKQQGLCRIVSRDECNFWKGSYHEEATLCSQVDCLGATCGMLSFLKPDKPDQIYRLWMALFLHAGVIHLACTLVFNFFILRDIEKMAGWLRVCIIYLCSGIGGYLVSAIVIPYQVEVGPSGSMFGIIACLFVELIQSWQMIAQPWKALLKLCGIVLLLLLVGLLPYVDNFAHMAGFMFGFLLAFIFLPYVTFGKWDRRRKRLQILVAFAILITINVVLFVVFLVDQETNCEGCKYLNCVPFTDDFCENYNLGQKLQSRIL